MYCLAPPGSCVIFERLSLSRRADGPGHCGDGSLFNLRASCSKWEFPFSVVLDSRAKLFVKHEFALCPMLTDCCWWRDCCGCSRASSSKEGGAFLGHGESPTVRADTDKSRQPSMSTFSPLRRVSNLAGVVKSRLSCWNSELLLAGDSLGLTVDPCFTAADDFS